MTRIIIGIALITAALQANAALQQEDTILGRACCNGPNNPIAVLNEKRVSAYLADTGILESEADPRQWMAHKGPTDENGCHKDEYDRWHCH
uniref:Uncharacterized protein n=1 Tax=Candidatus Kentrum sp. LPFa TaxID=2126335 RepID=A0A450XYW6_9GAMM|nr:MAG: hypothetical protein BECKLPF1236A_GA0070988_102765 [Candidatus Kentron sp. LPFa]VFK34455.1 MAG: hypothetical protein BECKLPF1236C_GA0070990_102722 [Candidatus Kentron sp. LPFa]